MKWLTEKGKRILTAENIDFEWDQKLNKSSDFISG